MLAHNWDIFRPYVIFAAIAGVVFVAMAVACFQGSKSDGGRNKVAGFFGWLFILIAILAFGVMGVLIYMAENFVLGIEIFNVH